MVGGDENPIDPAGVVAHRGGMRDPLEGVTDSGTIRTGAALHRVAAPYRPVLAAVVEAVAAADRRASVLVYGSVATGQARPPGSDVDLLTIGLAPDDAARIGAELSERYASLCRGVEIGAGGRDDTVGDSDEAYGNRVFLRHYCVHLAGPEPEVAAVGFPADARAARGFNGDLAGHARRWRHAVGEVAPDELARRVARKTLLAVAGLVSVADGTWTTDRDLAARRWAELEPGCADELARLAAWTTTAAGTSDDEVAAALDGIVEQVVAAFDERIGLWPEARLTTRRPP
ncbi:MAG: nucleotidyltransferase domain-containing protein [Actinomycetota bacterium]|nr:nucleotidyltransferase domain-containing protein [Actinomycetota bacterium]